MNLATMLGLRDGAGVVDLVLVAVVSARLIKHLIRELTHAVVVMTALLSPCPRRREEATRLIVTLRATASPTAPRTRSHGGMSRAKQ
jgi:hypothetical protein